MLKKYAILKKSRPKLLIGYFCVNDGYIYIELNKELSDKKYIKNWNDIPFHFLEHIQHGNFVMSRGDTEDWVNGRVYSPYRQDILAILKELNMTKYIPLEMFIKLDGRNHMDDFYIKEI